MWAYLSAVDPAYKLLVKNSDRAAAETTLLIEAWKAARYSDARPMFEVSLVEDIEKAKKAIERRDADLLVEIPEHFGERLKALQADGTASAPQLTNYSDEANPRSSMAMALSDYVAFGYAYTITQISPPST